MSRREQNQRHYQKHKARIDARNQEWREANPKHFAFLMQRQHSRERGIDFLFSLDEWIEWWGDDYDNRGDAPDDLVMARYGDEGPYHPDNVYKSTAVDNAAEGSRKRWSKVRETA